MHAAIVKPLLSTLSPTLACEVAALTNEATTLRQICEITRDPYRRNELEAKAMLIETAIAYLLRQVAVQPLPPVG